MAPSKTPTATKSVNNEKKELIEKFNEEKIKIEEEKKTILENLNNDNKQIIEKYEEEKIIFFSLTIIFIFIIYIR